MLVSCWGLMSGSAELSSNLGYQSCVDIIRSNVNAVTDKVINRTLPLVVRRCYEFQVSKVSVLVRVPSWQ